MNFTKKQALIWLVLINFFTATEILAQSGNKKEFVHQSMYWINLSEKILISPTFTWNVDFQERRFAFPDRQNQFLMKTGAQKKLNNGLNISPGVAYRWQTANQPTGPVTSKSNEIRLYQDFAYKKPLNRWILNLQTGLDERFLSNRDMESHIKTNNFNLRSRTRIEFEIIILGKEESGNPLKAKIAEEFFLNLYHSDSPSFFDQNRIYGGLNYQLSPHFGMEIIYYYNLQKTQQQNTLLIRDMLKLGIQHTISLHNRNQEINN